MDDGEIDFSNHESFSSPNMGDIPSSCSMDSFFDDILKDTHACTHTHTCNPPGPDLSHTHTCFHVHTKIVSAPSDDTAPLDDTEESGEKKSKRRPSGNREAVRKYREKKKARAASLEDEVIRLRGVNQQLLKRLQGQAALESEIVRLRCLLVDIRGRIEGEIGSFPYQKPGKSGEMHQNMVDANVSNAYAMYPCNVQCGDQTNCLSVGAEGRDGEGGVLNGRGLGSCELENFQCLGYANLGIKELSGCGGVNVVPNDKLPNSNRRKGKDCNLLP